MSTRQSASARRASGSHSEKGNGAAAAPSPAPWNLVADLGRQQLAVSTEAASVLFRGSEAIRKIQQQAAHQASLRHQEALQKLQASSGPAELLEVQAELLRFDVEQASQYWQKLAQAAMQTQVEMLGCAGHLFNGAAGDSVRSTWFALQSSFPPPRAPGSGAAD